LVFICCAVFGYAYASQRTPERPEAAPVWMMERTPAMVHGVVDRVEPRPGNRLRIVLRDNRCEVNGKEEVLPGKIAWSQRSPDYRPSPGQSVTASLRVVPVHNFGNPGSWDFAWYWQRQGVFWRAWAAGKTKPVWSERPQALLWDIKSGLRQAVSSHLPETQGGAMVFALITGDRSRLAAETMEATRSAGLAHTLALSGLHVGFVAAMGLGLAFVVGWIYPPLLLSVPRPKLAVMLAAPLVLGYAWLGQPSASLIRAATMFGFWGILLLQGRGRVLLDGLFFALVAILFFSPLSAFDLSLQMSVTAVAGISLMYPRFGYLFRNGRTWYGRLLGWAGGLLLISISANIALMPLVSWYFGTMSPNILLNLLWLPVLGFVVMPLGLMGMILTSMSWTLPLGSALLGWAAVSMDWLLGVLFAVNAHGLTPAFSVLRPLWPEMLGFAVLAVAVVVAWGGRRRVPVSLMVVGFLLLVGPHVFVMVEDSRDEVRLTMLDVGLGQSLVISTPGGRRWLVDGGAGSKHFDIGEAVVAPALTRGRSPRLDGVFMTHPDVDHSHGLPFVLDRFDVGAFYTNGMLPRGRTGKRMKSVMERRAILPTPLVAGDTVSLGFDTVVEILHPDTNFESRYANERSLVLRLVRNDTSLALLPGDVEKGGLAAMLSSGRPLDAEVLVLPHHGSKSSFDPRFYAAVSPELALSSNGFLNRWGFPHAMVTENFGADVLTTSDFGQVNCIWDRNNQLVVYSLIHDM